VGFETASRFMEVTLGDDVVAVEYGTCLVT
jgi:hypothetical protein